MGISKTEINLRRLLASAPQQQNQAKLIHYIATLREQSEQLSEERTADGLPRVSKAVLNDYSEKIEAIASKLAEPLVLSVFPGTFLMYPIKQPEIQLSGESLDGGSPEGSPSNKDEKDHIHPTPGLRRRFAPPSSIEDRTHSMTQADASGAVKLDAAAQEHIEKHRKLQDDLTDEMVGLARQLKQSSLLMSQSLQNTEKILDSTEKVVEQSLASTGHADVRAKDIYSKSSKTSCFTWLAIFAMTCIFIMVVLLIRVT